MNEFFLFIGQITQGIGYASAGSVLISKAESTPNAAFTTSIGIIFLVLAFVSILVLPFRNTRIAHKVIIIQGTFSFALLIISIFNLFLDKEVIDNTPLLISLTAFIILIVIVMFTHNVREFLEKIKLKGWWHTLSYISLGLSFTGAAYVFAKVLVEHILSNKTEEPIALMIMLIISVFLMAIATIFSYFSKRINDNTSSSQNIGNEP
jgi:peptidoglycan/LPS O-acetylase OafA/YrhL